MARAVPAPGPGTSLGACRVAQDELGALSWARCPAGCLRPRHPPVRTRPPRAAPIPELAANSAPAPVTLPFQLRGSEPRSRAVPARRSASPMTRFLRETPGTAFPRYLIGPPRAARSRVSFSPIRSGRRASPISWLGRGAGASPASRWTRSARRLRPALALALRSPRPSHARPHRAARSRHALPGAARQRRAAARGGHRTRRGVRLGTGNAGGRSRGHLRSLAALEPARAVRCAPFAVVRVGRARRGAALLLHGRQRLVPRVRRRRPRLRPLRSRGGADRRLPARSDDASPPRRPEDAVRATGPVCAPAGRDALRHLRSLREPLDYRRLAFGPPPRRRATTTRTPGCCESEKRATSEQDGAPPPAPGTAARYLDLRGLSIRPRAAADRSARIRMRRQSGQRPARDLVHVGRARERARRRRPESRFDLLVRYPSSPLRRRARPSPRPSLPRRDVSTASTS